MLKLLPICLLVVIISCESGPREISTSSNRSMTSTFKFDDKAEYVDSFNRYHLKYKDNYIDINDITIKMVSSFSKPTTIGYCYPAKGEIHLLESFWNYASHIEKEALIYHELGHCFLNRSHQSGKVNGLAISYMYPDNDYINFYDAYKDAYVEELFTGNSSKIKKILASERNTSAALNTNNQGIVYTCGNDHI